MKPNVGSADKIVRYLLALALAALMFFNVVEGTLFWVAGALAIIFVATALMNFCPIWAAFGVNTRPKGS